MHRPTSITTRIKERVVRHGAAALVIASLTLIPMYWVGCNVQEHYDMLSFFFDGVPNANAPGSDDELAISQSPTYTEHKPFVDDDCLSCHPNPAEMLLTKNDADICLKCHTDITHQYPVMHGAVVGMACLWCHDPHRSPNAYLLRSKAPELCLQCHEQGTMDSPIPQHEDLERDCLECHSGHGGSSPYFLLSQNHPAPDAPDTTGAVDRDGL